MPSKYKAKNNDKENKTLKQQTGPTKTITKENKTSDLKTESTKIPKGKIFKSKFHESMQMMFKKELENRRASRVHLVRKGTKNKFFATDANGNKVTLNGHYAYVTKTEGTIVAWPKSSDKHNDTCHFALSDFAQEVNYAGEVIFSPYKKSNSEYAKCDQHDNASGTYKPDAASDSQSGLPVETFKLPNFAY